MLWKKLLSSVLLSLLLSQSLFADYVLTDEAYNKLIELQENSEQLTKKDKQTILELEMTLSLLEKKQTISEQITALDQILIEKQEKSLMERNTSNFLGSLKIFFWGLTAGLIGGFYAGFRIGK